MTTDNNTWQADVAAAIWVDLGRDLHLASCGLAQEGGPDATIACAECDRAYWMHATRHETCPQFSWVTPRELTDRQIGQLASTVGLPDDVRQACSRALNTYALAPYYVDQARQTCANAINAAKRRAHEARQALPENT
ncbi:MAG TPA: hypothetical protein VLE97_06305 [Gaiellaceae bacterium]|nr:hypothetical protein [Gaiellaceae bacterium]